MTAYSVAAVSDNGQYNCTFTLSTNRGRQAFTETIDVAGRSFCLNLCGDIIIPIVMVLVIITFA